MFRSTETVKSCRFCVFFDNHLGWGHNSAGATVPLSRATEQVTIYARNEMLILQRVAQLYTSRNRVSTLARAGQARDTISAAILISRVLE